MHDDSPSRLPQNHFKPTDPGTSWIKDGFVSINIGEPSGAWRVLTPNVIVLPDGRYRMYHCGGSGEHKNAARPCALHGGAGFGAYWRPAR